MTWTALPVIALTGILLYGGGKSGSADNENLFSSCINASDASRSLSSDTQTNLIPTTLEICPILILGMVTGIPDAMTEFGNVMNTIRCGKSAFETSPSTDCNFHPAVFRTATIFSTRLDPGSSMLTIGLRSVVGGTLISYGVPRNADNTPSMAALSSVRIFRGPASRCREMMVACCNFIVDCCEPLIPSSNSNNKIVHIASSTTPTITSSVGIEHFRSASNTIPTPTATEAKTPNVIKIRCGQRGSTDPEKKALIIAPVTVPPWFS